jgi:hypothetical protein
VTARGKFLKIIGKEIKSLWIESIEIALVDRL